MKLIILLAGLLLTGCSTTNITKLVDALAKDPATVRLHVNGIYGSVDFVRIGGTNGCTIAPDGTLTVKP